MMAKRNNKTSPHRNNHSPFNYFTHNTSPMLKCIDKQESSLKIVNNSFSS